LFEDHRCSKKQLKNFMFGNYNNFVFSKRRAFGSGGKVVEKQDFFLPAYTTWGLIAMNMPLLRRFH